MSDEANLTEDQLKFIEKLGLYYENYGVPRIGGKILGLLLISDKPISAEQISLLLDVSRGSISTNIRLMVTMGFLEKVSISKDRADYYKISDTAWENVIKIRLEGFKNLKSIVEFGIENFTDDNNACKQLHEMLDWVDIFCESNENALLKWKNRKN